MPEKMTQAFGEFWSSQCGGAFDPAGTTYRVLVELIRTVSHESGVCRFLGVPHPHIRHGGSRRKLGWFATELAPNQSDALAA
jgi:hypothetical protein